LKIKVDLKITLDDASGFGSIKTLVGQAALNEPASYRLETDHNIPNECITLIFQFGKNTSPEEDLGDSDTV
jgi:hypothetical protein